MRSAAGVRVLEVQKRSRDWTKEDGQFVPMTTTYLNQERYEPGGLGTLAECRRCHEPTPTGEEYCHHCQAQLEALA